MDAFILIAFTTLITIINPVGAIAPFLAMTIGDSHRKQHATAKRAAITSAGVLMGCALAGAFVFRFYGITLPALKISGGILLFFIAFDMINARPSRTQQTQEEEKEGAAKDDVAIFPIGIPLLSGPGSIVSTFILADKATTFGRSMALYVAIVLCGVISYLVLAQAHRLAKLMGQIGMNVMSRIMGIMLAASAVQFVLDGLRSALG